MKWFAFLWMVSAAIAGDFDERVQQIAEDAMRNVDRGAAVVIDPADGTILAMVSRPAEGNAALKTFAPGAAWLPVTALAGLPSGLAEKEFTCSGGVTYGGKFMRCWIASKGSTHGALTLREAMTASCNPFFYQYGNAAGIGEITRIGRLLGLGARTGIPVEGEEGGILPGPEWLQETGLHDEWTNGHTANVSIGQGYVLATPLQMASVAATLANGGTVFRPHLRGAAAEKVADLRDEGCGDIEVVRRGMWDVANVRGVMASRVRIEGVEIAGQTGTAQVWRGQEKD